MNNYNISDYNNKSKYENLISNPDFLGTGSFPEGWTFESPRPELTPEYSLKHVGENKRRLIISSVGDIYSFGCWSTEINLEVGQWYYASVRVKIKNIENPDLSICAHFAKHFLVPEDGWEEDTLLRQVFRYNSKEEGNKVELYLRCAETGSVEWYEPYIAKIEPPKHRIIRAATVRFGNSILTEPLTLEGQRERIARKLEEVGSLKPDIVVFPEFSPVIGVPRENFGTYFDDVTESVPDGKLCRILSGAASKYGMYVIAGIIEKRDKYMFNTAVIFDRKGNFIGQYDKTHLTFGEMKEGFSCGKDYPVFDLDFGRIGIHICYDEWFPEVSRYYAHKGAEILFLPVAGGKPITWRTRALDNGIYFISSSINPPSMIIDSSGAIIAETHDDGIAFADLNLDYRKTNWYIDPTLSYGMPYIVLQMRNTTDNRLIEELGELMKKKNIMLKEKE